MATHAKALRPDQNDQHRAGQLPIDPADGAGPSPIDRALKIPAALENSIRAHAKTIDAECLERIAAPLVQLASANDGAARSAALAAIREAAAPTSPVPTDDEIRCLSAEEVAKLPGPVTYPIKGFALSSGSVCVWGAVSWAGKSIALQDACLAVAAGQRVWHEFRVDAGRVVHVDMEQGDGGTIDRYRRLARARKIDFDALYTSGVLRVATRRTSGIAGLLSTPGAEDRYKRLLDGCSLAFIDTLAASTPGVEENDKEAGDALYALGRVAQATGSIVVVTHHFTKAVMGKDPPENPQAWFRGHGSIFAATDYAYAMTGKPNEPRLVQKAKGRSLGDPMMPPFCLEFATVPIEGYLNKANPADPGGFEVRYRPKEAVDAERDEDDRAAELRLEILEFVHRKAVVDCIRYGSGEQLRKAMGKRKDAVLKALGDLRKHPAKITETGAIDITETGRAWYAEKRGRSL